MRAVPHPYAGGTYLKSPGRDSTRAPPPRSTPSPATGHPAWLYTGYLGEDVGTGPTGPSRVNGGGATSSPLGLPRTPTKRAGRGRTGGEDRPQYVGSGTGRTVWGRGLRQTRPVESPILMSTSPPTGVNDTRLETRLVKGGARSRRNRHFPLVTTSVGTRNNHPRSQSS